MNSQTAHPSPAPDPQVYQNREMFKELAMPLVEWLNETYGPHATVIITCSDAEVLEGVVGFTNRPVSEPV